MSRRHRWSLVLAVLAVSTFGLLEMAGEATLMALAWIYSLVGHFLIGNFHPEAQDLVSLFMAACLNLIVSGCIFPMKIARPRGGTASRAVKIAAVTPVVVCGLVLAATAVYSVADLLTERGELLSQPLDIGGTVIPAGANVVRRRGWVLVRELPAGATLADAPIRTPLWIDPYGSAGVFDHEPVCLARDTRIDGKLFLARHPVGIQQNHVDSEVAGPDCLQTPAAGASRPGAQHASPSPRRP